MRFFAGSGFDEYGSETLKKRRKKKEYLSKQFYFKHHEKDFLFTQTKIVLTLIKKQLYLLFYKSISVHQKTKSFVLNKHYSA